MERRLLGSTGIPVTPVCFGGWQAAGWDSSSDEVFKCTLSQALDSGVNFIDTAPAYGKGHSENLIAEVIKNRDRDSYVIASKFNHFESQPKRVRLSVERSLARLDCDYIDLLQQHWPVKKPAFEKTLEELLRLKEEGLIRGIGVCNWLQPEFDKVSKEVLQAIDTVQPCYSLLWRQPESILELCTENGITMLPYSPLAQGLLALGKIPESNYADHRGLNILFGDSYRNQVQAVLAVVRRIANERSSTCGQVALRWLLEQPAVASVIVGSSSPAQLLENIGCLELELSTTELVELSEVSTFFVDVFAPHDTMWGWHSLQ